MFEIYGFSQLGSQLVFNLKFILVFLPIEYIYCVPVKLGRVASVVVLFMQKIWKKKDEHTIDRVWPFSNDPKLRYLIWPQRLAWLQILIFHWFYLKIRKLKVCSHARFCGLIEQGGEGRVPKMAFIYWAWYLSILRIVYDLTYGYISGRP